RLFQLLRKPGHSHRDPHLRLPGRCRLGAGRWRYRRRLRSGLRATGDAEQSASALECDRSGGERALAGRSNLMLLLIDNYDSFTYNLYQYLSELGAEVIVRRNDRITFDEIAELGPERIVISPGPGDPADAGVSV